MANSLHGDGQVPENLSGDAWSLNMFLILLKKEPEVLSFPREDHSGNAAHVRNSGSRLSGDAVDLNNRAASHSRNVGGVYMMAMFRSGDTGVMCALRMSYSGNGGDMSMYSDRM